MSESAESRTAALLAWAGDIQLPALVARPSMLDHPAADGLPTLSTPEPDARRVVSESFARHHFTVQPIRTRTLAPELGCDVARVVAYRARCTCGFDSAGCATFAMARQEGRLHRAQEHPE